LTSFFDEELGKSIGNAGKKLTNFKADDLTNGIKAAQKEAKSFSLELEEFNKTSAKIRDGYVSDMQTIATNTVLAQDAVNNFADNLESVRNKSATEVQVTNRKIIEAGRNNPVGNAVPSPSVAATARLQGEINVNFSNKPDDVSIVTPASNSPKLVVGGSG